MTLNIIGWIILIIGWVLLGLGKTDNFEDSKTMRIGSIICFVASLAIFMVNLIIMAI